MPKVVVKGESVYKCSVCSRSIRVTTNKFGLDVLQRCNITYGCQGKLHRVTVAKDINSTPAFPPEVQGVQDWFQRKVLYTHEQPVASQTWTINHNLTTRPKVYAYVQRIVDGKEVLTRIEPKSEDTQNLNTTVLTFETAESGRAQCVSMASQNTTNANAGAAIVENNTFQVTSNSGELTLATLNSDPLVGIALTYRTSGTTSVVIEYAGIDSIPSVESPWAGASTAIINGREYTIRSLNVTTTPLAPTYFAAGAIPDGSTFYVSSLNGSAPLAAQCLVLLAREPFATVDRIYDQYVDVAQVNTAVPELFYSNGKAYTYKSIIRPTYPPILVV